VEVARIDRRVRRTRELLREALVSLVLQKGYERVTVQDIIDRADVGRSTFYAHFRDREDLLLSVFEEIRDAFEAYERALEGDGRRKRGPWPTLALFEHASEYRALYQAMIGRRGPDVLKRHLHTLLSELMREHLGARAVRGGNPVPLEVIVEFAVSSLLGLLIWWLDGDRPYSAEEMIDMYGALTEAGIRSGLGLR
jgi:AcrR family transcriptional regulator